MAQRETFQTDALVSMLEDATKIVKDKLVELQKRAKSGISIPDMFDMQMLMNKLAQLSEMCTSVVAASNTSIMSMARNIKG